MPTDDETELDRLRVMLNRRVRQWRDRTTRNHAEDLVQETLLAVWLARGRLRDPSRVGAFGKTVLTRKRARLLRSVDRLRESDAGCEVGGIHEPPAPEPEIARICVAGEVHERSDVIDAMRGAMDSLQPTARRLLRGFYAGVPGRHLADSEGIAPHLLKMRLHRGRKRLRCAVEQRLRRDDPFLPNQDIRGTRC